MFTYSRTPVPLQLSSAPLAKIKIVSCQSLDFFVYVSKAILMFVFEKCLITSNQMIAPSGVLLLRKFSVITIIFVIDHVTTLIS